MCESFFSWQVDPQDIVMVRLYTLNLLEAVFVERIQKEHDLKFLFMRSIYVWICCIDLLIKKKKEYVVLICDILLCFRNLQNYLRKIVLEWQINKFPSLSLYKILTSITSVWVPHSLVNECDQTGYDCIMLARK